MTLLRPVQLPAALLLLALAAGCAASHAPVAPQDSTKFTLGNTNRFAALDPETEAAVDCTGLQARMLGDGRLEVVANVKNRRSQPVTVQIESLFFDSLGRPVGEQVSWQALAIGADSTEVVRFTAPSGAAINYTIQVRRAR